LASAICGVFCACTWLDHPTSFSLRRELEERSSLDGLATAIAVAGLSVKFFDGRTTEHRFRCCSGGGLIQRNRIVWVDRPPNDFGPPEGPLLVLDTSGAVVEQSQLKISSQTFSVSPDEKTFAFLGGGALGSYGLYIAGFQSSTARKLKDVSVQRPPDSSHRPAVLDWSPDGQFVLFSDGDTIETVKADTGESREIADGFDARWSPAGGWISYVRPDRKAALLNLATGETKMFDESHDIGRAPKWSPDGRYLLFREAEGSHWPDGCTWAYRISDSAFVPLTDVDPRADWITMK